MNPNDFFNLKPGVAINLLVETRILGWIAWEETRGEFLYIVFQKPKEKEPYKRSQRWETDMQRYRRIDPSDVDPSKHTICGLKDYSTDISAAWEVLEIMNKQYTVAVYTDGNGRWAADIDQYVYDDCKTAQEAICKAALLTVNVA